MKERRLTRRELLIGGGVFLGGLVLGATGGLELIRSTTSKDQSPFPEREKRRERWLKTLFENLSLVTFPPYQIPPLITALKNQLDLPSGTKTPLRVQFEEKKEGGKLVLKPKPELFPFFFPPRPLPWGLFLPLETPSRKIQAASNLPRPLTEIFLTRAAVAGRLTREELAAFFGLPPSMVDLPPAHEKLIKINCCWGIFPQGKTRFFPQAISLFDPSSCSFQPANPESAIFDNWQKDGSGWKSPQVQIAIGSRDFTPFPAVSPWQIRSPPSPPFRRAPISDSQGKVLGEIVYPSCQIATFAFTAKRWQPAGIRKTTPPSLEFKTV